MGTTRAARLLLTLALAAYGVACLRSPDEFRLLDNVDLAIHETGHLVFLPFGEFVNFLGGTLFQLIVPAAFVAYFLRQGDRHAACVALWWVAQNCWNVARYVADARAQELPLVGGGEHDWAYLLGELGWLARDQQIAGAVRATGTALLALATAGGLLAARGPRALTPGASSATARAEA
ncbi:MAG: hypothetical protein ACJ79S_03045 [Gemmatimonadaceae bacterium]